VRSQAKKDRDFTTADEIRDDLVAEFDVTIQDKIKQWSVGGDFGADGNPRKPRGVYTRRGGGDLSEEDIENITMMLHDRTEAKKCRDFDNADEIRAHLIDTYSLSIDDKAMEWRVDSDVFVQVSEPGTQALSAEDIETICAKLAERHALKLDRDYEAADDIRDELEEEFSVAIDDRNKEWRCVQSAGEGASEADSKFVEDALKSQSSAFKRTEEDREFVKDIEAIFSGKEEPEDTSDESSSAEEIMVTEEETESAIKESSPSISEENLSSLTVPLLKEKLRDAGLPVSGKKAELIERLLTAA
jgi:hypothetical protein